MPHLRFASLNSSFDRSCCLSRRWFVTSCYIYLLIPIPHLLIGSARVIANLPSGTARGKQLIFQIVENCLLVYVIQLVSNSSECRGHRLTLLEKPSGEAGQPSLSEKAYMGTVRKKIYSINYDNMYTVTVIAQYFIIDRIQRIYYMSPLFTIITMGHHE